ncbi:MAG: hypothetical protein WA814_09080 [Candidatus Baltobacteraceae bacterium]
MPSVNNRAALLVAATLLATSACGGNGTVPSNALNAANPALQGAGVGATGISPDDTTSILKLLKKQVVIGSTVDPKNGDTGPRGISMVPTNYVLKKGQLLVCNFNDSSGKAGNGTTIEVLNPKVGSSPTTFVQSTKIQGCDGDAVTTGNQVYATGMTSKSLVWITQSGKVKKSYAGLQQPFADTDAPPPFLYDPEYIFIGDSSTGSIYSLSLGLYGTGKLLEVVSGFATKSNGPAGTLGPSGLQVYTSKQQQTLYVVDGANNTIVAISNAGNLLEKDEIVVQPGGKTFKCKHPQATCASLVMSGSPLNAPIASALLPNGNLVVANTKGGNTLVELTPKGQVLATKTVDSNKTAGVFGLLAIGKNDSDTALFFTDANANNLQELQQ